MNIYFKFKRCRFAIKCDKNMLLQNAQFAALALIMTNFIVQE